MNKRAKKNTEHEIFVAKMNAQKQEWMSVHTIHK